MARKLMGGLDLRNKPSRNGFDLSFNTSFTSKCGELLPICVKEIIPGDKVSLTLQGFTRTQPLQSDAFVPMREYYDVFFVPLNQLWRYAPDALAMVGNTSFPTSQTTSFTPTDELPYFRLSDYKKLVELYYSSSGGGYRDFTGTPIFYLMRKLWEYLGYGNFCDTSDDYSILNSDYVEFRPDKLSLFRFLAYQKIYNDFYRFDQWQKPNPVSYNVDYLNSSTNLEYPINVSGGVDAKFIDTVLAPFLLRRVNWQKDYFTGLLPSSQYGDPVGVDVQFNLNGSNQGDAISTFELLRDTKYYVNIQTDGDTSLQFQTDDTSNQLAANIDILKLRIAEFAQKWSEIAGSNKSDYMHQIEAHFGVKPNSMYSNMCRFLDGWSNSIDINEVINTNLAGAWSSDYKPDIAGKGAGSGNFHGEYEFNEHGIFMVMYHNKPLLRYNGVGCDVFNTKVSAKDYAIPEFDKIGMQTTQLFELFSVMGIDETDNANASLGYAPRYVEYKTSYDKVLGEFMNTLKYWSAPMTLNLLLKGMTWNGPESGLYGNYSINSDFFRVNPSVLDQIFGVSAILGFSSSTQAGDITDFTYQRDQFLHNVGIQLGMVRNLDFDGLPY